MEKEILLKKLDMLRTRIEDYCNKWGYDKMQNAKETWGKKGTKNEGILLWKQTDWECVDSMYNNLYNGEQYFSATIFKELNKIWRRYKPLSEEWEDEPTLKSEFEFDDSLWDNVIIIKPPESA
jgi:hypothetical protein